mgnify:CR=1 FL=1
MLSQRVYLRDNTFIYLVAYIHKLIESIILSIIWLFKPINLFSNSAIATSLLLLLLSKLHEKRKIDIMNIMYNLNFTELPKILKKFS